MAKKVSKAKTAAGSKKEVVSAASIETKTSKAVKKTLHPDEFYGRVAFKAHELYVKRGGNHGDDYSDWFEAERWVRTEFGM